MVAAASGKASGDERDPDAWFGTLRGGGESGAFGDEAPGTSPATPHRARKRAERSASPRHVAAPLPVPVAGPEFHARFRLVDPLGFSAKGVDFGQAQRVVVTRVEPWGQADTFAVQIGDVILRVGGDDVEDQAQCDGLLRSAINAAQSAPHLVVTYMHPDVLQPAPASPGPASPSVRVSRHGSVSIERTPPAASQGGSASRVAQLSVVSQGSRWKSTS